MNWPILNQIKLEWNKLKEIEMISTYWIQLKSHELNWIKLDQAELN